VVATAAAAAALVLSLDISGNSTLTTLWLLY